MAEKNLEERKAEMVQKYLDGEIDHAEFIAFNQTYMCKERRYIPLMKHSDDKEFVEKAAAGDPEAYETIRQLEMAERTQEIRKAQVEYTQILKTFNNKVRSQVQKNDIRTDRGRGLGLGEKPVTVQLFSASYRILNRQG